MQNNQETNPEEFICSHCGREVEVYGFIGTKNRNHCPYCLWSKHVDKKVAGDRASSCHGNMKPIGLTFKNQGVDKYGKEKEGELMLVHECEVCGKININRIAADDDCDELLKVLETSKPRDNKEIILATIKDKPQILKQLFGE